MNEIGANFETEATKAMAVAVYSNIKHQNARGSSPSFILKTPTQSLINVVKSVAGEMICYNGSPILATFFSCSPGVTASAKNVWGVSYPYLVSVDSGIDAEYEKYEQTVSMTAAKVMKALESKLDIVLDENDKDGWFEILSYHDDAFVEKVRVGGADGVVTTARNLRENILGLRSAAFDVEYDAASDSFLFTTRGYGHGVGMSQIGASFWAAEGWDYVEILEHYYPGASVE